MQTLIRFQPADEQPTAPMPTIAPVQREDGVKFRRRTARPITQQIPTVESCRTLPRTQYTQSGLTAFLLVHAAVNQFVSIMRQLPVEVILSPQIAQEFVRETGEAVYYAALYAQSGATPIAVRSWPLLADDTAICYGRI